MLLEATAMTILITGGAGFIGANFALQWMSKIREPIINIDKLTYAGNISNLSPLKNNKNHLFVEGDIGDYELIEGLLSKYKPRAIINFAAETHVDRSIKNPEDFIDTNIVGTFRLLENARSFWSNLKPAEKNDFRFLHISTDEVYGSLSKTDPGFSEEKKYEPNSPYSASKASSDHLVRSYNQTYSLPVLTTNCSNNYGPYQHPEKLIPVVIRNAIALKPIPLYGDGDQIRDWLYVEDHCAALRTVLTSGKVGEVYNIGGETEKTNLEIAYMICAILDRKLPLKSSKNVKNYHDLIINVDDRLGHDRRYAVDISKIRSTLNWGPSETFSTGIDKTIDWYLNNEN
jgi:dTDP-glucose 4,6-dehydratase